MGTVLRDKDMGKSKAEMNGQALTQLLAHA
jgi:hypothetical protein